jgi:fatty acid desaturase
MDHNNKLKIAYELAEQMKREAISKGRRSHYIALGCWLVLVAIGGLAYWPIALVAALVLLIHVCLLPSIFTKIRRHEDWVWGIIIANLPEIESDDPDWIRKLLHKYRNRMKYRYNEADPDDPADWWKYN